MINNTLTQTIYSKRWSMISWFIGMAALVVVTMIFYPTLRSSFGEALKNVPDSLKAFIGNSTTYSTIAGYTDLQVFFQFSYIIMIYGVILFTGVLAGEENDGTLQTLLAQPISRSRIYLEKLAAAATLLAAVCASLAVGVWISLPLIHQHIGTERLLISVLAEFLIALVFSSLGYAIGAATGKRGLAGAITGVIAFTSLLITSLGASVKSLKTVDRFSPFHYFDKPGILLYGPHWHDLAVLAGLSLVILVAGYLRFVRRDIYLR